MNLDQIVPAISLIAVLILVLPAFLRTNSKLKQFMKNLERLKMKNQIQVSKNSSKKLKVFGKTK